MKNNSVISPAISVSPASGMDLETARRLIVLVPEFEGDAAIAAQRIREVARALESRVQLLGLSCDAAHESAVRRRLITLSALVEEPAIYVEVKVEVGNNWLSALQPHWRSGDVVVCFSNQRFGITARPLHEVLSSNLDAPVYVLSGVLLQNEHPRPNWVSNTLAWAGSLGLIFVFLLLQIRIAQPIQSGFQSILLYASLIVEGGAIWFWNNLFG